MLQHHALTVHCKVGTTTEVSYGALTPRAIQS